MITVDGTNSILGRLASFTAKKLLTGEEIKIFNAEKAIITGDPTEVYKEFIRIREIGSPQHGPFYPKRPDMIVKRTVRGMLPHSKKGRASLKKLKVYIGNPDNVKGEQVAQRDIKTSFITVGNLAKQMGWKE